MIPTSDIRTALHGAIEATGVFEEVRVFAEADLGNALDNIRHHQASLCIVAPGEDEWTHDLLADNTPVHAEVRNRFELLVTARELDAREEGVLACVDLKDQLCEALLWSNLGIPVLVALPQSAELLILTDDDQRRGREAWRITLEVRQHLH